MEPAPPAVEPQIDDVLRRAFDRVDDDDVRLFYAYFDELKTHVRRYLHGQAKYQMGESHVAQSAMFSMFCDLAVQDIPLQDVDEHGYPMVWPLLLKYVERHCEKWKKFYRAKKRAGGAISLSGEKAAAFAPMARGLAPEEEAALAEALSTLQSKLTPRQRRVADLSAQGKTLEEIADEIGISESLVSLEKKAIRSLLEEG